MAGLARSPTICRDHARRSSRSSGRAAAGSRRASRCSRGSTRQRRGRCCSGRPATACVGVLCGRVTVSSGRICDLTHSDHRSSSTVCRSRSSSRRGSTATWHLWGRSRCSSLGASARTSATVWPPTRRRRRSRRASAAHAGPVPPRRTGPRLFCFVPPGGPCGRPRERARVHQLVRSRVRDCGGRAGRVALRRAEATSRDRARARAQAGGAPVHAGRVLLRRWSTARVLWRQVLLLDEATSALDAESEAVVQVRRPHNCAALGGAPHRSASAACVLWCRRRSTR